MGATPTLTIAGLPVSGGHYGAHEWTLTMGLGAPEILWALPPDVAAAVLAETETEIVFTAADGGGEKVTIKRVVVVNEVPSGDPLVRVVRLSDVRWYLPRKRAFRSYNVRLGSSGQRRLLQVDGVPQETLAPIETPTYATPSLKGDAFGVNAPRPYTAAEVMADVQSVCALAPTLCSPPRPPITFRDESSVSARSALIPQDVQVDAASNVSLGQALGLIGGVDVFVDLDGAIVFVNAFMGAERAMIERLVPYSLFARGMIRWISMASVAPHEIRVLYTREVEVRADGIERQEGATQERLSTEQPVVTNVIQVTDLTLPGVTDPELGGPTYTAIQGMFVPVDSFLAAVELKGDRIANGLAPNPLTRRMICDAYHGGGLQRLYVVGLGGEPNYLWQGRVGSIMRDYRLTWRLNPRFAARCVPGSIRPLRAALLDPATGTRQPSSVWADYCRRPTIQGIPTAAKAGWNVNVVPPNAGQNPGPTKAYSDTSFPSQPFPLTSCTTTAPAILSVVDPVTGVFRLDYVGDPQGYTGETDPSLVQDLPTDDIGNVNGAGAVPSWAHAKLLYSARVAFIFSAIPWGPNSEASLHKVVVQPSSAVARLGASPQPAGKGPAFELRVGTGLTTARIAWDDGLRNQILGLFTESGPVEGLTPVNLGELTDLAGSLAASLMAIMLDHFEGSADIGWTPSLRPLGSCNAVSFKLDGEGGLYTGLTCAQVSPPANFESFLTPATRAILFRAPGARP